MVHVVITSINKLLKLAEFYDEPKEIVWLFSGIPCLDENGVTLSLKDSTTLKIACALYPAHEDLIVKHKFKFAGFKQYIQNGNHNADQLKKVMDVVTAYNGGDQSETHFLRWASGLNHSLGEYVLDYCFEKGYLTGINEGLINAVDNGRYRKYYPKFLDAGADPTISHCAYAGRTAIARAFEVQNKEAISLFIARGYDLSAKIAKIPREKYRFYGIPQDPVKKMINGILYTMADDKKTATAVQLTANEGLVTTQLSVVELASGRYMFINQANQTVFGEPIPASAFAE